MKKKTSTKKKNNSTSRTVKKPATKKTPAGKKKPASKKKSATNKKPVSKKKPAGKKKPASPKKASKPASSVTGHRAVEKKHSKAAQRPRILPKDTPFPLKFSARSNKAIEKYVYNKKSGIHGMGAFARSRIPKGAYVGSYEGIPSLDDDIYVLWVEQDSGSWRGIDGKNELRYLNHSSRPNVEWDENRLYSIRAIEPDEELTFHYGDEWEDVE
ncbi:MAG: SET domain-containing protein-lysine N-methyltransferase [Leptospiraceae bacterium]